MSNLSHNQSSPFDSIRHVDERGNEFWLARELMPLLEYTRWDRVPDVIDRAKFACENSGNPVNKHFSEGTRKTGGRDGQDYKLSRYGCYLVAMNGDPRKPAIAQAQSYFAAKTHEAENSELTTQSALTSVQQTLMDIDLLVKWIAKTNTEENLLEQAKYDTVANIHPEYRPILEAAKKVRSTEAIHSSVGLTPTQIGKHFNPIKSAKEVNDILESLNFQFKEPKKKRGKDSYVWQLTEEGKKHGFVYFASKDDKWSGDQIRWQDSVIAVLQSHIYPQQEAS